MHLLLSECHTGLPRGGRSSDRGRQIHCSDVFEEPAKAGDRDGVGAAEGIADLEQRRDGQPGPIKVHRHPVSFETGTDAPETNHELSAVDLVCVRRGPNATIEWFKPTYWRSVALGEKGAHLVSESPGAAGMLHVARSQIRSSV